MSSPDNNWLLLMLLLTYRAMQNSDGQIESIQKANEPIVYMDNDQCIPKDYLPINPSTLNEAFSNSNIKWYKKLEELQKNCECIEWEQDMNMRVPFCMIDGQLCNGQCRK